MVRHIDYSVGHDAAPVAPLESGRESAEAFARGVVASGRLSPRTVLDLVRCAEIGGALSGAGRDRFLLEAETERACPVFRLLESLAAEHCLVRGLVSMGWDRLDFAEVGVGDLAAALRAAFDAGRAAGASASDASWRRVIEAFGSVPVALRPGAAESQS